MFDFLRKKQHSREAKVNLEAFSDGQMVSKIWLCDFLESLPISKKPAQYVILGSWYGTLALFLFVRNKVQIQNIILNDIDMSAIQISMRVLERWTQILHVVKHFTGDANELNYEEICKSSQAPTLIINTSVEHFHSQEWLKKLPQGTQVLMQSTDMAHPTHINRSHSLKDFEGQVSPFIEIKQALEKKVEYEVNSFTRFMIYGEKR